MMNSIHLFLLCFYSVIKRNILTQIINTGGRRQAGVQYIHRGGVWFPLFLHTSSHLSDLWHLDPEKQK